MPRLRWRVGALCNHLVGGDGGETPEPPPRGETPPPALFSDARRATRCGPGGELSAEQCASYARDGFLLVSGLIPDGILQAAVDAMWRQMAAENRSTWKGLPLPPRETPLDRRNPDTWSSSWQGMLTAPEILATFTPAYLRCARQLASANAAAALFPVAPHQPSKPLLTRRNPWAPPVDRGYQPDRGPRKIDPVGFPFVVNRRKGSRRLGYPVAIHNFPAKDPIDLTE